MMKKLRQEDQLASLQQLLAKNQLELERISSNRAELMQSEVSQKITLI